MKTIHVVLWLFIILVSSAAHGQDAAAKPIRIVTSGIGGSVDLTARLIAQSISGPLGQQVFVDNRVGVIAAEIVAKSPPDGTMLLLNGSSIWLLPYMRDHVAYDPIQDFLPVILASKSPNVLVVHPALPVKSTQELLALARAKPGALNYGTVGTATSTHLAAELFRTMANINIVRIPYKAPGPALNDLIAGEVQLMLQTAASATPHIKTKRLKALAVTSARPSDLFPGLPTLSATGIPGYEAVSTLGILAPAKTTAAVITRLNQEIGRALSQQDLREKLLLSGVETGGGTPEHFAATIKSEMTRMGKVIRDAGIRDE